METIEVLGRPFKLLTTSTGEGEPIRCCYGGTGALYDLYLHRDVDSWRWWRWGDEGAWCSTPEEALWEGVWYLQGWLRGRARQILQDLLASRALGGQNLPKLEDQARLLGAKQGTLWDLWEGLSAVRKVKAGNE